MIDTKIVTFNNEYSPKIIHIRTRVFVKEQGVDASIDFDGLDEKAVHVLVLSNNKAIGTARILEDGHIGRVAVLKEHRKKGAGYAAISALIETAKQKGLKRVYLGSQIHASKFYKNMGFKTCGEEFMDAGIKHIEMEYYL